MKKKKFPLVNLVSYLRLSLKTTVYVLCTLYIYVLDVHIYFIYLFFTVVPIQMPKYKHFLNLSRGWGIWEGDRGGGHLGRGRVVILGGGGHMMFRSPILQGPKMGGNLLVPRILYCTVCADGVLIIRLNSMQNGRWDLILKFAGLEAVMRVCMEGGGQGCQGFLWGMPRMSLEACQGCL